MKGSLIVLFVAVILSCNNTRVMSANSFDQYARTEQVTDSFLLSLQQQNEVVIAFAVESYAWVRSVDYKIITLNKGVWKGYTYYKRTTGGVSEKHETINVSNDSCNGVWKFIQTQQAWKIKGDNGKDFCSGSEKKNCNINDGVTWRMLIITKDKITDPSYYEPAYFEECCPGNTERKLFIETVEKIKRAVPVKENEE
ncbi:hypothetical protein FRZ67_14420 [Panacibacter ginsenosidivorans]|uniref:Lipoprotein n=1 Tax=Panacibacter ginsenosidivorans TaxID=1813871 RepID=A0A5B8VAB7_9BACT|nr:hypothetical protein [Panacibacter ginsenosidivorans]QEC68440.1 hypothetical protein FRZ67_14420 [Panacibacter ginsenosidivorans]